MPLVFIIEMVAKKVEFTSSIFLNVADEFLAILFLCCACGKLKYEVYISYIA
jgi:hypothetical protein